MNASLLINQDSKKVEYFTPPLISQCARGLMGYIDLDPASCPAANAFVMARYYYTLAENGLTQPWYGNVWLNHPFNKVGNRQWINRLLEQYNSGKIIQACCITFASTSEGWFAPLLRFPQFYFTGRVNYVDASGQPIKGVTKGSVVTFLPPRSISILQGAGRLNFAFTQYYKGETKVSISSLSPVLSR